MNVNLISKVSLANKKCRAFAGINATTRDTADAGILYNRGGFRAIRRGSKWPCHVDDQSQQPKFEDLAHIRNIRVVRQGEAGLATRNLHDESKFMTGLGKSIDVRPISPFIDRNNQIIHQITSPFLLQSSEISRMIDEREIAISPIVQESVQHNAKVCRLQSWKKTYGLDSGSLS